MLNHFQFNPVAFEHPRSILAFVIGVVIVGALLAFVNVPAISLPYLKGVWGERETRVAESQRQVDSALEDMRRLRDDYSLRLKQIEVEARERIDAAVREAENAQIEIAEDARQAADALRRRADEELARERVRSRILLRRQVVDTALTAAESAIRADNTDSLQRDLIQDFINRAAQPVQTPVGAASSREA